MQASRRKEARAAPRADTAGQLLALYDQLEGAYGAEHWHWYPPHVRSPIDVVAGAILVQHTTWRSAERALEQLRAANVLNVSALVEVSDEVLRSLIRVSGTPSVKARRLRAIAATIRENGGMEAFLSRPDDELRTRLLATHGIGEETADAIMLYAASRRAFVIDAYTRRLFSRLELGADERAKYRDWRRWFESHLPDASVQMFQRYHAYIVLHGRKHCRALPRCGACPLRDGCPAGARVHGSYTPP